MDRVERHDLINALALAAVLLAMALALVWGARELFRAIDGTVTSDTGEEVVADGAGEADTDSTPSSSVPDGAEEETTTTTAPVAHVPSDVIVRVGNGARIKGVAGSGTSMVEQAGYRTIAAKNAPATESSTVYYVEGYEADALGVARVLGIAATQTAPMPADPGVPQGEAHLVVILGADTTVPGS